MGIYKKAVYAAFFFVVLLLVVPMVQMLFFNQQTSGRIVVNKPIEASYLNNVESGFFIVYFGYVGCEKVCAPILHNLSTLYESDGFSHIRQDVGLVFVNLMPESGSGEPDVFAKLFHPAFRGIYLTQKELMGIDRQFTVFFSKSISEPGLIDHSDYIYLMQKTNDGKLILHNIYMTHPLNQERITDDISLLLGRENR